MKKLIALLLATAMLLAMVVTGVSAEEADTIVVMVPPVTNGYGDLVRTWIDEWKVSHPNITIELIETSWDDHNSKLSTMALAGEAPDIAEIAYNTLGTYVEMGVGVDISKYIDLSEYDENAVGYMSLEGTTYGLPLYVTIQALGGNKAMLEAAGVDVAKVQSSGWSYDEFLSAIKAGTKDGVFGFVFANQGITTSDLINIFGVSAGLTNPFTSELKYAFTSQNMLNLLNALSEIIASGAMPNYTVAAGDRMKMLQKGETMITGKAMPLFEGECIKTSEIAKSGTNEEGYIDMEYVFLPVPAMEGVAQHCYGQVDGLIALRNSNTTDEHLKNVCEFMNYLCTGERIAAVDNTLYLPCVCKSGREAQASTVLDQTEGNATAAAYGISLVVTPPAGVTAEQSSTASQIMNEVIVPKFEALIAGEATGEQVYQAICEAAFAAFGEVNCETGLID